MNALLLVVVVMRAFMEVLVLLLSLCLISLFFLACENYCILLTLQMLSKCRMRGSSRKICCSSGCWCDDGAVGGSAVGGCGVVVAVAVFVVVVEVVVLLSALVMMVLMVVSVVGA